MSTAPPILFLIFNRPEETARVFQAIRQQKPARLYIAADGPRADVPGEKEVCGKVKKQVLDYIDWDCKVHTLIRPENIGCKLAVSQAITWFFEHEEQGIVLEDDCLPDHSFFTFCAGLLIQYKNEPQVMMICGTSYQPKPLDNRTYYFSKYMHVWGWATWRRAWQNYNADLEGFSAAGCKQILLANLPDKREHELWSMNFKHILNGFNTWDYQWQYSIWKNNGLTIIPWQNTIANIGFGPGATHTFSEHSAQAKMQTFELRLPLSHPKSIQANVKADRYERYAILISSPFSHYMRKALQPVKNVVKRLLGWNKS